MQSYFDIKALPSEDIVQSTVVAHLMQALHKLLPHFDGEVGVDFPAYGQQRTLGGIIRLLGADEQIQTFHLEVKKAAVFDDYALVTELCSIPENVSEYSVYTRKHIKGSSRLKRLRKRRESNDTWTEELAAAAAEKFSISSSLPHLCLSSSSTGQSQFMLFVQKRTSAEPRNGKFNGYGLSIHGATVPKF
jgi:CRISPR-associated endonuclease Csy4